MSERFEKKIVPTSSPAARLRHARQSKFPNAKSFAESAGVPQSTYQMHEQGQRRLTEDAAKKYAPHLGVDYIWLLHGPRWNEAAAPDSKISPTDAVLPHLLLNAPGSDELGRVIGEWQIPRQLIIWAYAVPGVDLRIVQMDSDDMDPTIKRGVSVIVRRVTSLSSAGIYLIKTELGHSFRRVELLPGSPVKVRLLCDNQLYQSRGAEAVDVSNVTVKARALGRIPLEEL
jgi:hypothetical protein